MSLSSFDTGGRARDRFLRDPLGLVLLFCGTLLLGYGDTASLNSPIRIPPLEAWQGGVFGGIEVLCLAMVVIAALRRAASRNRSWTPNRLDMPVFLIAIVLAVYPFVHLLLVEGGFRIPYEANFVPFFVVMYLVWRLTFEPGDMRLMIGMFFAAGLYKCVEGILVFLTNDALWGALTGWRDGMLLTLGVAGGLLALAIRPDKDDWYAVVRRHFLLALPLFAIVFVLAMRRSYMVAFVATIPFVLYRLQAGAERRRLWRSLVLVSPVFVLGALFFGFDAVGARFTSILVPTGEGSAAWRLIEYYNVANMIAERPFTGWPWGVEFVNATGIDLPTISTLTPHNIYLYALLRGGLIGLFCWLWLLVRQYKMSVSAIRHARSAGERFVGIWMMIALLLVVFSGLTSPVLASRLTILLPFLMVFVGFLPGANASRTSNWRPQSQVSGTTTLPSGAA